jgi:hypothetical protein
MKKKQQKNRETPVPKDETYRDKYGWPLVGTRAHTERMKQMCNDIMKKHPFFASRRK